MKNNMDYTHYDPETRTWSGHPRKSIYHRDVNIATVLLRSLENNPQHIGQINAHNGCQLTNDQIRMNAIRLAIHLQHGHLAVRQNDVIGVVSKNHDLLSAVVLAAFALAAPVNPLDPNFQEAEIVHMFRITRPKFVFCESESISKVRNALRALSLDTTTKLVTVDRKVDDLDAVEELILPHDDENTFIPTDIVDGSKQSALILCTSGTTGLPKGVVLSQALVLSRFYASSQLVSSDVYLSFSSIYWLTGVFALVAGTLAGITRIITTQPFSPDLMLQLIEKYGVTITLTAPYHLALLLQCPTIGSTNLSTLRKYYCGGSAVGPELSDKINKLLPIGLINSYGISEGSGTIAFNEARYKDSVGTLCDGLLVQIVDDDGRRLGPDEDGEIYFKTPIPFNGYCGNEVASAEAFDKDGWFRTGDMGHFDENRFLFLADRKKDIIKYCSFQISPAELENIIMHCNGVANVCVVGIPDSFSNDLPAAVVVREIGKDVNADYIKTVIKDQLSDAKQLRGGVYFVDSLPVTPSGKIKRREVMEIAIEKYNKEHSI